MLPGVAKGWKQHTRMTLNLVVPVGAEHPGATELGAPVVYGVMDFDQTCSRDIAWKGDIAITADGTVNALRFITKNILALLGTQGRTQDWLNDYLVLPLTTPVEARIDEAIKGADAVVWGIPFDAAVSNRPGARFGPQAIRAASISSEPIRHSRWIHRRRNGETMPARRAEAITLSSKA